MAEPKCPGCGHYVFEYRYIFPEGKTQEWKERLIQFKADGRNNKWIQDIKKQFNDYDPCAIIFCTHCGHIIGAAK